MYKPILKYALDVAANLRLEREDFLKSVEQENARLEQEKFKFQKEIYDFEGFCSENHIFSVKNVTI